MSKKNSISERRRKAAALVAQVTAEDAEREARRLQRKAKNEERFGQAACLRALKRRQRERSGGDVVMAEAAPAAGDPLLQVARKSVKKKLQRRIQKREHAFRKGQQHVHDAIMMA